MAETQKGTDFHQLVRKRAHSIWEAEGRPSGESAEELWRRARAEIEEEFRLRTAGAGDYAHRWKAPLEVEEALTPGKSREAGGLKWDPTEGGGH